MSRTSTLSAALAAAVFLVAGSATTPAPGYGAAAVAAEVAQAHDAAAATGVGTVNAVAHDDRKINITHEPMPEIGWPKMTMEFAAADGVDIGAVAPGDSVRFSLAETADGHYVITAIETMSE